MKHDLAISTMDGKYLKTTVDGYSINESWLCYWTNNPYLEIMINKDSIFRLEIRKSIIEKQAEDPSTSQVSAFNVD